MGVPEPLKGLERTVAEIGVRAVRIAGAVGELVVLAMVGHPGHDVAFDTHLTEHREQVTDGRKRLERAVREQSVVPDGDPQPGEDVAHREDGKRGHPDTVIPEQDDGDGEPDDG